MESKVPNHHESLPNYVPLLAVGCPLPGPTVWERGWVALIRMLQTTCSYIAIVDILDNCNSDKLNKNST